MGATSTSSASCSIPLLLALDFKVVHGPGATTLVALALVLLQPDSEALPESE
jgi:hypothetical protein